MNARQKQTIGLLIVALFLLALAFLRYWKQVNFSIR
jgi:hypothetical protein